MLTTLVLLKAMPSANTMKMSALAACLAVAACGSEESAVESAARNWLDALNDGNLTAAQEMSTDATKGLLQMASSMGESMAVGDYDILEVKMNSDTAAQVTVDVENDEKNMVLDMVKIDGDWKVGVRK
jgi:hypothetical protein